MPLQDAVEYCRQTGIEADDTNARETGRLDKLARFTQLPISSLVRELTASVFSFEGLTPNKEPGPLTLVNKIRIRDHYSDSSQAIALSKYLNTSYQNVRLAQRGQFVEQRKRQAPTTKPRPLTLSEKMHIRDHRAHEPTADLAREYNTRYQYVQAAQLGEFKEKQHSWVTRKITPQQAADLGITSTTIKVRV